MIRRRGLAVAATVVVAVAAMVVGRAAATAVVVAAVPAAVVVAVMSGADNARCRPAAETNDDALMVKGEAWSEDWREEGGK